MRAVVTPGLFGAILLASGLSCTPERRQAGGDLTASPDRGTHRGTAAASRASSPPLGVREISFAGPAGHRPDASFMPGEVVTCLLTVSGFTYRDQRAHIRTDIRVTGTEGQVVVELPGQVLLDGPAPTARPGTIRTAAELRISAAAPPGRYTVRLRVRDELGRGEGVGEGQFTLLGSPTEGEGHLAISELRWAAAAEAPPGAVVPAALVLKGLTTRKIAGRGHKLHFTIAGELVTAAGLKIALGKPQAVQRELPFSPDAYPSEHQVALPADLAAGEYQLLLEVQDRIGERHASGRLPLRVVPAAFGIYTVHLHDASGMPRERFLLGEQAYARLAVFGLTARAGQVDVSVDLGVAGPDGGVYLARKKAVATSGAASRAVAEAGRFPAQIPLVLPSLAPTGKYRLVVRARDGFSHKEAVAERSFSLTGNPPRRLDAFAIDSLEVRERPDLAASPGDTFVAGRTYHLTVLVGGLRLRERRKLTYSVEVEGGLRLLTPAGAEVHKQPRLFALRRDMSYRPLRLPLTASWQVPADLPAGLYDLEIAASDLRDRRESLLRRRVEIVRLP